MSRLLCLLCLIFLHGILISQGSVSDIDGNSYSYVTYGTQVWTVENAEMVTYRDGTPIPYVQDDTEWSNLTTGAWCYSNLSLIHI